MSILRKRNIFRIESWVFVFIFLMLIFSGVNMAQQPAQKSEYLKEIVTCKDILEKDPVRETNIFFPQDEKVVLWFRFSYNAKEKFMLKWEWITPQSKLYHRGELEMEAGSYSNYRTWYWIKIKDGYTSKLPGEWKVKVYLNDTFLGEKNFFIIGSL